MNTLLMVVLLACMPTVTTAQSSDEESVRKALMFYIRGHATGVADTMALAFHPSAELKFIRNGQYTRRTLAEYLGGFDGKAAADEAQRKRRIVSIDVAGNAASAELELDYPGALITDYMQLLKIDGEWKIVHKVFHTQQKANNQ